MNRQNSERGTTHYGLAPSMILGLQLAGPIGGSERPKSGTHPVQSVIGPSPAEGDGHPPGPAAAWPAPVRTVAAIATVAGDDIKLARRVGLTQSSCFRARLNMPPETTDEPDTENDAAKEAEDSKERPEDHSGCHRRYQCAQLPSGSRSHHVTSGSQRGSQVASCASHLSFPLVGPPALDGQDRAGNWYLHQLPSSRQITRRRRQALLRSRSRRPAPCR